MFAIFLFQKWRCHGRCHPPVLQGTQVFLVGVMFCSVGGGGSRIYAGIL